MDRTDETAAELTIIALGAAVPSDTPFDQQRFLVSSDKEPIDWSQTVEHLALLPKPVACSASVEQGLLLLRCGPPTDAQLFMLRTQIEDVERRQGIIGWISEFAANKGKVLVLGRSQSILVDPDAVARWFSTYVMDSAELSLSTRDPTPAEQQTGATCVLELGRAEHIDPKSPLGQLLMRLFRTVRPL